MESAFGVDHGRVSKAQEYKRDVKGRFAQHADAAFHAQRQLIQSEHDPETWKERRKHAENLADDLDLVHHGQLADDIWMTIEDSKRYQKLKASGKAPPTLRHIKNRGNSTVMAFYNTAKS